MPIIMTIIALMLAAGGGFLVWWLTGLTDIFPIWFRYTLSIVVGLSFLALLSWVFPSLSEVEDREEG